MRDAEIETTEITEGAESLREADKTAVFVVVEGGLAGILAVADPTKASTSDAIRALHDEGVRIVMLTGARPVCRSRRGCSTREPDGCCRP